MSALLSKNCLRFMVMFVFSVKAFQTNAQHNFDEVEDWLQQNKTALGGRAIFLIYKDDKLVLSTSINDQTRREKFVSKIVAKRMGENGANGSQDFSTDTKMSVASCSKWLSAALVMTFVDEGLLKLNDSIGKFLPQFSKKGKGNITIQQCLSHTTGIDPGNSKESRQSITNANNMNEAMDIISSLPMEATPGTAFNYGNVGLQIAAAVIEKISNKNFNTLFKERIAFPCSMINTDFGNNKVPLAAGGAYSTPKDYLNFLKMILNKGEFNGKRILSQKSIAAMQQNYTKSLKVMSSPNEAGDWGYGLGEWIMTENATTTTAVSSPGLFGTFPWVDVERNYAAILFTFNLKSKGRHDLYTSLQKITENALKSFKN